MNYYIGIDIGTTAAKTVAFSETGEALARFAFDYTMYHPQPDYSELNPDEIFDAVIQGIQQVLQTLHPHYPVFISFSAAMHSLIVVNDKAQLLTPCIIWADNRATAIAGKLKDTAEGKRFYGAAGVPIHPMSPLCKLLWLKEHEEQLFNTAFKFIGIKEYIFLKLFGEFLVDTSIASATGLLNIQTLQWSAQILQYVGLKADRLSAIVSTKHICYYKGNYSNLKLPDETPFIIGASDGALSNIGSFATGSHAMAVSIGTSSAVRIIVSAPETDHEMRTFCYHANDRNYIVGGAGNNGAVVLQWLKENILQTSDTYEDLFKQAESIPVGCNGLIILPYILGERAPLWNAQAKAVMYGLTISHTKAHLIRAVLESIIYSVYSIGKIVAEEKPITELYASGGFVNSHLWVQMLSDLFNIKVLVSGALESAALGAVIVGAEAMDLKIDFRNEVLAVYSPDEKNHTLYQRNFKRFERLYELLKNEMSNEA